MRSSAHSALARMQCRFGRFGDEVLVVATFLLSLAVGFALGYNGAFAFMDGGSCPSSEKAPATMMTCRERHAAQTSGSIAAPVILI